MVLLDYAGRNWRRDLGIGTIGIARIAKLRLTAMMARFRIDMAICGPFTLGIMSP